MKVIALVPDTKHAGLFALQYVPPLPLPPDSAPPTQPPVPSIAFCCSGQELPLSLRPARDPNGPQDVALVLHTSGTSGTKKVRRQPPINPPTPSQHPPPPPKNSLGVFIDHRCGLLLYTDRAVPAAQHHGGRVRGAGLLGAAPVRLQPQHDAALPHRVGQPAATA